MTKDDASARSSTSSREDGDMTTDQLAKKIDDLGDKIDALLSDFRLWSHEVKRLRDRVAALESKPPEAAE
jgi:hypothetical protein